MLLTSRASVSIVVLLVGTLPQTMQLLRVGAGEPMPYMPLPVDPVLAVSVQFVNVGEASYDQSPPAFVASFL